MMDNLLILDRMLLASLFTVAGIAKLFDLTGSRQSIQYFGIPASSAKMLAIVLPLTELSLAFTLIPAMTAWWGALGALGLFFLFIVGISLNLIRGHKPDCHCFGALVSTPPGWRIVVRNGILAVLAGFIVWQGPASIGPSIISWLLSLRLIQIADFISLVAVVGLLAADAWILFHLLRQNGWLPLPIEMFKKKLDIKGVHGPLSKATSVAGLPIGVLAPAFQLSDLDGNFLTLDSWHSKGVPLLLIFFDPACGSCNALIPEILHWQEKEVHNLTTVLISRGKIEPNIKGNRNRLLNVLLQRDGEVAKLYRAHGTPSAVIIRTDGTIGSPLALGADAIRKLVSQTIEVPMPAPSTSAISAINDNINNGNERVHAQSALPNLKDCEAAPAIKLPDLNGTIVNLQEFRGEEILVLFFNPNCGSCRVMINDLKTWEANPAKGVPKLLLISTGTIDENRYMGLRALILLDPSFSIGSKFGVNRTPSAILINGQGAIISEVAVGANEISDLMQPKVPVVHTLAE